jgi:hypothetical protein
LKLDSLLYLCPIHPAGKDHLSEPTRQERQNRRRNLKTGNTQIQQFKPKYLEDCLKGQEGEGEGLLETRNTIKKPGYCSTLCLQWTLTFGQVRKVQESFDVATFHVQPGLNCDGMKYSGNEKCI